MKYLLVLLFLLTSSHYAFAASPISVKSFPIQQTYQGATWSAYVFVVEFGTPSQKMDILIDGGLDMSFLFSTNCTQPGCGLNPFYPDESSTLTVTDKPINYTYAAGNLNVIGNVARDITTIGGLMQNLTFGLINQLTQPETFPPSIYLSGVFGFAYPSEEWGSLSLIQQFAQDNDLDPILSLWFPKNIYENGVVTFGGSNPQLYSGKLTYVPLLPSTWAKKNYPFFWSNVISDIKINGVSNNYCKRKACNFFIDLAGRPMDLANAIPKINVAPDCSNISHLDTYTFTIGGMDFVLTPDDYVLKIVEDNNKITCESGIYGGAKIGYPFTLGYTWISNVYTVLDFESKQIGFAPAVHSEE